jgi:phosphoribosylglycinamide formyltransferase-1
MILFAYNFPHKKTQDFLFHLAVKKKLPAAVVATNPIKLNIPKKRYKYKMGFDSLIHPKEICDFLGVEYFVSSHDSEEVRCFLKKKMPRIGLISGARIIGKDVIDLFEEGVINFHPGLIPESRGLDAMLWSVYKDIPLGVTAHFIDHKVDAGWIIKRREIKLWKEDTWLDISNRLYDMELTMLDEFLSKGFPAKKDAERLVDCGNYNKPFPPSLEESLHAKFNFYKDRFGVAMG